MEMEREFENHAENLLAEADRRNWCGEYDTWVESTNSGKRHLFFQTRENNWNAYYTVEVEMPRQLEREIGYIDGVYNVEVEQHAQLNVSASFTCRPGDEANQAEEIRSSLYGLSGVNDVTCDKRRRVRRLIPEESHPGQGDLAGVQSCPPNQHTTHRQKEPTMRRSDTTLLLTAIQQMSAHIDSRLDAMNARVDTSIDTIGDLRRDLLEHIRDGHES